MQQIGARFSESDDIHDNGTGHSITRRNSWCDLVLTGDARFPSEIHCQLSWTCNDDVMRVQHAESSRKDVDDDGVDRPSTSRTDVKADGIQ
jgi:hypothetical protein